MIKKIVLKNFRSIEKQTLELAPITIFYGPTASGKSSILYALLVLKNFILNPNRPIDGFFNLKFMDLSGFIECLFNHDETRKMGINISYILPSEKISCSYGIDFSKNSAEIFFVCKKLNIDLKVEVSIPYSATKNFEFPLKHNDEDYKIQWNGITCNQVIPQNPTVEAREKARKIAFFINSSTKILKEVDIVPHKRGFFKPFYTPAGVSSFPVTEDEVASMIIDDQYLQGKISVDAEKIFGRDFRLHTPSGTAHYYFMTTDKESRVPSYLVNDGFGINQIIYLLSKLHRRDVRVILIEEPEVHLHPTMIRNLVRVLCSIIKEEKKITRFQPQEVNEEGQIEGGLSTFVEAELQDLEKFLGERKNE